MANRIFYLVSILFFIVLTFYLFAEKNISGNEVYETSAAVSVVLCNQTLFATDLKAFVCGQGCCFSEQSCYKGMVCCDSDEIGNDIAGIYYCKKKKCDARLGLKRCGNLCYSPLTEECREQGVGSAKVGNIISKVQGYALCHAPGQSACPVRGKILACCKENEECMSRKVDLPFVPDILDPTVWGCTVSVELGCGEDTLCEGTEQFDKYRTCCKKNTEQCIPQPNGFVYCRAFSETKSVFYDESGREDNTLTNTIIFEERGKKESPEYSGSLLS